MADAPGRIPRSDRHAQPTSGPARDRRSLHRLPWRISAGLALVAWLGCTSSATAGTTFNCSVGTRFGDAVEFLPGPLKLVAAVAQECIAFKKWGCKAEFDFSNVTGRVAAKTDCDAVSGIEDVLRGSIGDVSLDALTPDIAPCREIPLVTIAGTTSNASLYVFDIGATGPMEQYISCSLEASDRIQITAAKPTTLKVPVTVSGYVAAAEAFGNVGATEARGHLTVSGALAGVPFSRGFSATSVTVVPDVVRFSETIDLPVDVVVGTQVVDFSVTGSFSGNAKAKAAGLAGLISGAATAGAAVDLQVGNFTAATSVVPRAASPSAGVESSEPIAAPPEGLLIESLDEDLVYVDTRVPDGEGSGGLHFFRTFSGADGAGTDFVTAGVGGLRNVGSGTIDLAGVSGQITSAWLYWHGPTNVADSSANADILVDGRPVTGTNLGFSNSNCWEGFTNSQTYRADVTALVEPAGNGTYALSGFGQDSAVNTNGASLVVFFDDGDPANDRDVIVFDGNDSNKDNPFDPPGWGVEIPDILYDSGPAFIEMHVADGQTFDDGDVVINGAVVVAGPEVFEGDTVPSANNGPTGNGSLWDIRAFDVEPLLSPGRNTLELTSDYVEDCLSAVVALVALPAGAAPPPLADCNTNGLADGDDLASGRSSDCDANEVPDECDPDRDGDRIPDACDGFPDDLFDDVDADGVPGPLDNCPLHENSDQADRDADGRGDVCDVCPDDEGNPDQDGDSICDDVDRCPLQADPEQGPCDLCPPTLDTAGCREPGKSVLVMRDKPDDRRDRLVWRWLKGTSAFEDLADPTTDEQYSVCLYGNGALSLERRTLPGGACREKPCWKSVRDGFKYVNRDREPDGIVRLLAKAGDGKAKIVVRGKGTELSLPGPVGAGGDGPYLETPVAVQLRSLSGQCWQAEFSVPTANDARGLKAGIP